MIDGNPLYPDLRLAVARWPSRPGATLMGASPGFLMACRKAGPAPGRGPRPVPDPADRRGRQPAARRGLPLGRASSSGPRCCSTWAAAAPTSAPASCRAARCSRSGPGRSPGRCLGVAAQAFDEQGNAVVGELGELVITAPMPSMPVGFWGDDRSPRRLPLPGHLLRRTTPASGGTATGSASRATGSCVDRRPLGRHPEPRRRPAGHRRVLPGRGGAARGRRQPGRAPGGPGRRQRGAAALRRAAARRRAGRRRCAARIADRAARRRCRPGTSRTRSPRCPRSRGTGPGRSWSCR